MIKLILKLNCESTLRTWIVRKLKRKNLETLDMWSWRRMEKLKWSERVTNEVVDLIGEKRTLINNILRYKIQLSWSYSKKKLLFSLCNCMTDDE